MYGWMDVWYTLYQYLNVYCTDYNKSNNIILAKIYHQVMKLENMDFGAIWNFFTILNWHLKIEN